MERVLPAERRWALHCAAASRRIESAALAASAPHALMQKAGWAVARLAQAIRPHAQRIWVAAGPGNNGGDGFEAACRLQRQGRRIEIGFAGDAAALPADAASSLRRAQSAGVVVRDADSPSFEMLPDDLAIDAVLGLGARRAPDGALAALVNRLNTQPAAILAVDVPSGLDPDTGQPYGSVAVRADHTLALLTLKPGLFTGAGRDHSGTVWFDGLDVNPTVESPDAWLRGVDLHPSDDRRGARPGFRLHAQHKGSFGDVIVVGGAPGMGGAAVLAARAAHAAGAGRVWLASLDADAVQLDMGRPELMWRAGLDLFDDAALERATVVCGCGGGDRVVAELPRLLMLAPRLVLDADALNAVAIDATLQAELVARHDRHQDTLLTPHPLEAARLLGCTTAAVQARRLTAAQALADRYRCGIVLKGSGSVIAAPGLTPSINASGTAALATAGTGDVLAGWTGGTWSAAAASSNDTGSAATMAHRVACASVWQHGRAAETAGVPLLRAADLIEEMARSLSAA